MGLEEVRPVHKSPVILEELYYIEHQLCHRGYPFCGFVPVRVWNLAQRVILGLPSQSAHPPSLNTGSPGCLAGNILGISDAVYRYLTISDHF